MTRVIVVPAASAWSGEAPVSTIPDWDAMSGSPSTATGRPAASGSSTADTERQNCAGSLSAASRESQALGRWSWRSQSAASAVLPAPAGATIAVTGKSERSSSNESSRGRGTKWRGSFGILNLDWKNGESSRPRGTTGYGVEVRGIGPCARGRVELASEPSLATGSAHKRSLTLSPLVGAGGFFISESRFERSRTRSTDPRTDAFRLFEHPVSRC